MSLFKKLAGFLTDSFGPQMPNAPEDITRARRGFEDIGFEDDAPNSPYMTRGLARNIERFQTNQGLKRDGIMRPNGETERTLLLAKERKDDTKE